MTIEQVAQQIRDKYRHDPGFLGVRTSGLITVQVVLESTYNRLKNDLQPSWLYGGFPVVIETLPLQVPQMIASDNAIKHFNTVFGSRPGYRGAIYAAGILEVNVADKDPQLKEDISNYMSSLGWVMDGVRLAVQKVYSKDD